MSLDTELCFGGDFVITTWEYHSELLCQGMIIHRNRDCSNLPFPATWGEPDVLMPRTCQSYLLLIMLTSLAPSPMASVMDFLCRLTRSTTMAFCSGVTRQQMTALHIQPVSRSNFSIFGNNAWTCNRGQRGMRAWQVILWYTELFTRNINIHLCFISMAWCKTAVTPLLMHWSYCSLALSHRYHSCSLK